MNKFLISFTALLAICSVCNGYGRAAYGARPAAGAVYQQQPAATVQILQPAGYGAGYGNGAVYGGNSAYGPASSAYGYGPISAYAPAPSALGGYGPGPIILPGSSYVGRGPVGVSLDDIRLAEQALAIPNLPALINTKIAPLPSNIYGVAPEPIILPAPIGGGYKIGGVAGGSSARASASSDSAAVGNKVNKGYAPAPIVKY